MEERNVINDFRIPAKLCDLLANYELDETKPREEARAWTATDAWCLVLVGAMGVSKSLAAAESAIAIAGGQWPNAYLAKPADPWAAALALAHVQADDTAIEAVLVDSKMGLADATAMIERRRDELERARRVGYLPIMERARASVVWIRPALLRALTLKDRSKVLTAAMSARVLVVDDMGEEDEETRALVSAVLCQRGDEGSGRRTIVTANMQRSELEKRAPRFFDRLREGGEVDGRPTWCIACGGASLRGRTLRLKPKLPPEPRQPEDPEADARLQALIEETTAKLGRHRFDAAAAAARPAPQPAVVEPTPEQLAQDEARRAELRAMVNRTLAERRGEARS